MHRFCARGQQQCDLCVDNQFSIRFNQKLGVKAATFAHAMLAPDSQRLTLTRETRAANNPRLFDGPNKHGVRERLLEPPIADTTDSVIIPAEGPSDPLMG